MATTSELVIKINGDIKDFQDALGKASQSTANLSDELAGAAKTSGVAFAALTAEIGLAVHAYAESEAATKKLNLALQNQGIYSKELADQYKEYAQVVQNATGIDDDALVAAQATIQARIGATKVTEEMTMAIADLSAAQGIDLNSSAELIGKGINGQTMALKRLGIEIDQHLSKEERTAQILDQVTQKFGGQASAANEGLGSIKGLQTAFGNFQEEIGARFAPLITSAIQGLTKFFQVMQQHKGIADVVVSLLAAGTAITGIVTVAATAGYAFLKFKAAVEAAKVSTEAMTLATRGLTAATGIGLLVALVVEIGLNWNSIWPRMQAVFAAFVNNIGTLGTGLADILKGVFTFDLDKIKSGLAAAKSAFIQGYDDYSNTVNAKIAEQDKKELAAEDKQNSEKAKLAAAQQAKQEEQQARELAALDAESELKVLKSEQASAEMIALKQAESEALKNAADENFKGDKDAMEARADELRGLQEEQKALDDEQRAEFNDSILASNAEYQAMTADQKALFKVQNEQKLREGLETEKSIQATYAQQKLQEQVKNNNEYLLNQQKFGTAYAAINSVMNSQIYQGMKTAFGDLAALQSSENSRLKAIGKVAAIANIVIRTAESAMAIYAGFSTIPIIGPALGLVGAAAAVAFGAENIGKVNAAAEGGLLTGGMPGVDSIPVLAQRGEVVSPAMNFEELIGSVRAKREADKIADSTGFGGGSGSGSVNVIIGFDGAQAGQVLTAQQIQESRLGTLPESAG